VSTPNCRTCGACCVEQVILLVAGDKVPILMSSDGMFMNKQGGRCIALTGRVGIDPCCSIYPNRPKICQVLPAGSQQCLMIRESCGLGTSNAVEHRS
jgi:hypothetical protein